MPGTIRVSVLEAVDLPDVLTDGTIGKDVTAKVTLGPKLFKTQPGVADRGKIASWNSDFAFPVMNLRDKLVISICDSEDHSVSQTAIEIPSIIQKGSRDEFVALNKGGRIHLRMSFVLTEEERKKIESMRVAALKRKEEAERLKKTIVVQPVTPEKELKKSPVSTVAIAEVDVSTVGDKDLKDPDDRKDSTTVGDKDPTVLSDMKGSTVLGDEKDATTLGDKKNSTPKRPAPKPMFNYAKAIGVPPSAKKTVKKPSAAVSDSSINELKTDNDGVGSGVQMAKQSGKDAGESDTTKLDTSVEVPSSGDWASSVTKAVNSTPQGSLIPAGEVDDELKANNGGVNSDVQTERESAENVEELDKIKLDGAESLGIELSQPPTEIRSGAPENSTDEVGVADKDGMAQGSAVEAGSTRHFKLDFSAAEASPSSKHESLSVIAVPADSASREQLRSSSSGPITLKTVKARVKRAFSRASSRRRSNLVSSSNSLSRNPAPLPVVWVQEAVQRALSNVKGCYGLNSATVDH